MSTLSTFNFSPLLMALYSHQLFIRNSSAKRFVLNGIIENNNFAKVKFDTITKWKWHFQSWAQSLGVAHVSSSWNMVWGKWWIVSSEKNLKAEKNWINFKSILVQTEPDICQLWTTLLLYTHTFTLIAVSHQQQ